MIKMDIDAWILVHLSLPLVQPGGSLTSRRYGSATVQQGAALGAMPPGAATMCEKNGASSWIFATIHAGSPLDPR